MHRFAALIDQLSYEAQRSEKLRLLTDYFRTTPDPNRGLALAVLTGRLEIPHAKPALLRELVEARVDPVLFGWSYDYVGDLAETIALIWPAKAPADDTPLSLGTIVTLFGEAGKAGTPALIARLLDRLDVTGRWAFIKMLTGGLRIGVSARLAKTAAAALGPVPVDEIEELWHGLQPPFTVLFAWLEGKAPRPVPVHPLPFRPVMLAHALEETALAQEKPEDFMAEWKWDGIRVQAAADGAQRRLTSRQGEDLSGAFPDLLDALDFEGTLDGELLVIRQDEVRPFGELQQRLNRKAVTAAHLARFPAGLIAYDLLLEADADLRPLPFVQRRALLEAFVARANIPRLRLSPLVAFSNWEELAQHRASPPNPAIEGVMLKRKDSPYLAGRVKGHWYKWKRDPYLVDAVLMYAQRGHGKRSSFYSDYTFGVWKGEALVPVGKAYFGFTDEELARIDRFVRDNTVERFGPVREIVHEPDEGLVLEIAFEGLQRSPRHKSGLAMRFPRIHRLRWDKPPREADRIETLEALLNEKKERP
jgi:ATP-dependent DNA ligase